MDRNFKNTFRKSFDIWAVGTAEGKNKIAIIIPCHRVVGVNKKLTGYAGGLDKKEYLLRHEGFDIVNSNIIIK